MDAHLFCPVAYLKVKLMFKVLRDLSDSSTEKLAFSESENNAGLPEISRTGGAAENITSLLEWIQE